MGLPSSRNLWDYGPVDHQRTAHFTVLHDPADRKRAEALAALCEQGYARLTGSFGRPVPAQIVVILPHTPRDEALRTAERIRHRVEAHPFEIGGEKVRVTVSVGVATFPSPTVDGPNALVREADRALYAAKDGGRNRVV